MKGVFLHIAADALGSLAVIIGAIVVEYTDWSGKIYIDPALRFAACAVVATRPRFGFGFFLYFFFIFFFFFCLTICSLSSWTFLLV